MEHLDHHTPHSSDAKMARFCSSRIFIIAWGGWGIIVPFYFVHATFETDRNKYIN